MDSSAVWVVIPAYNEARVLKEVLGEVRDYNRFYNIVVVDDGSSDETASAVSGFDVHILRHPVNLGQGAAIATGIAYALGEKADVVVTFDADGQMRAEDIGVVVNEVLQGGVDVALGSRFLTALPKGMTRMKKTSLKLATILTKFSTGLKITDTHNGLKAFRAEALRKIVITQNRMAHASEILSEIGRNKLTYREVPVTISYTDYSKAKGQSLFNTINILYELFTGGGK